MKTLHSIIHGSGSRHFVIMHGLFGQSDNWNTLGKKFAEYFTVHLVDVRNHGRSFHSDEMNFDLMSQDLENYLNHHQIENCIVLGHSMGGKIAMQFALNSPQKVEKLIVVDISPKEYKPHHQAIIKALQSVDFNEIDTRKEVDQVLSQYIKDLPTRQFLLKNLYWKEKNQLAFRFNLSAIANHYSTLIGSTKKTGKLELKSLFMRGENSNYIIEEDEIIISNQFAQSQIITIPKANHWVHATNPKDFYDRVLEFIQT